jgi:hypothetical protein
MANEAGRMVMVVGSETLATFYQQVYSQGNRVPELLRLSSEQVPEPFRSLLCHASNMTPKLANFHKSNIDLKVIKANILDQQLCRLVLLLDADGTPVEMGLIRIILKHIPNSIYSEVVNGSRPLGTLLIEAQVNQTCHPQGFFSVQSDNFFEELFQLKESCLMYGRCNLLKNPDGEIIAEVMEVLPPLL